MQDKKATFRVGIPEKASFKDCIQLIIDLKKANISNGKNSIKIREVHYAEQAYVKREEVYATIERYTRPEMTNQIKEQLDRKYPTKDWENYFPFSGAFQTLINENLESLVLE